MKVLIAHKNNRVTIKIKSHLLQCGLMNTYEILNNGAEAEEYIFEHQPDIAILDFDLSETDTMTIAKRLQSAGVPTRLIILANTLDDSILLKGLAYGILGYLNEDNLDLHLSKCAQRVKENLVYVPEDYN